MNQVKITGYVVLNYDCSIQNFETIAKNDNLEGINFELKMIKDHSTNLYKNDKIFFNTRTDLIINLKETYKTIQSKIEKGFKKDFLKDVYLFKSYDYLMKYEKCFKCKTSENLHVHLNDQVICSNCLFKCVKCKTIHKLYAHDYNYYCINCLNEMNINTEEKTKLLQSFPIIIDGIGKYKTRNNTIVNIIEFSNSSFPCRGIYKKGKSNYFNIWNPSGYISCFKNSPLDIIEKL